MQVEVGGKIVALGKTDVIKQGGEAVIYRKGGKAIKIYHQTSSEREAKLRDFWKRGFQLEGNVLVPLEPVTANRHLAGFTMKLLPSGYESLGMLTLDSFCRDFGISQKNAAELMMRMLGELKKIHAQGIVIGDLSDRNEVFHPQSRELEWLDVDSWQFGNHACVVGTEAFLSPELYGVDLTRKPSFTEAHDWYSFAVLLFMAIYRCHPYKGFHSQYKGMTTCAKAGITVLDSGVRYPKVGLPPEIVTDELRDELLAYLKRKKHDEFEVEALKDYIEVMTECPSCALWYPARLSQCPGCATKVTIEARLKLKVLGMESEVLIETLGPIIHWQVMGMEVKVLAGENGKVVLYQKRANVALERKELFPMMPGARYGAFDEWLVICPNPYDDESKLYVVDYSKEQVLPVWQTTTERLAGAKAVFGTTDRYLYRIAGGRILQGERFGVNLAEREVMQIVPAQTWFTVGKEAGREIVAGFWRNFEATQWFLATRKDKEWRRYEIDIGTLRKGETLMDVSIRFDEESALILRKTRLAGADWALANQVKLEDGSVFNSAREKVADWLAMENIHGKAYGHGLLVHPSDDGIIRETLKTREQTTLNETASLVDASSALDRFGNGLLVARSHTITALVPKK